jgi:hypothetical protein
VFLDDQLVEGDTLLRLGDAPQRDALQNDLFALA